MLIVAQKYDEALDVAADNAVAITDKMAEDMTLEKDENESEARKRERQHLLLRLADVLLEQKSYHLACKKYTQVMFVFVLQCL